MPYARTAIEHHANAFAWREHDWRGWLYGAPTDTVTPRCVTGCVASTDLLSRKVVSHLGVMKGLSPDTGEHLGLSANRMGNTSRAVELDVPPCLFECAGAG